MIDNIKAVAADIDMTLTTKGGDLPPVTREAFDILQDHGVLIGLATGRELDEKLYEQAQTWGMKRPFDFLIGMNGGMVRDRFHEGTWTIDLMSSETMKEILNYMWPLIEEHEISINVEGGGNHAAMYIKGEMFESMKRHGWTFDDYTGDIEGFCQKPCFKFLFRTTPDIEKLVRERFLDHFGDRFQAVGTYPGTVEMMQKGVDKGTGLQFFADRNNIDMQDIITFGDSENDNAMLIRSGWGVCLCDGTDGTKACANAITDYGCEEGGVGHYLVDYYLKEKGWI